MITFFDQKQKINKSEVETELKIKLSPKDMEKVFRTLVKKEGASKISHKFTPRIYYDTPELLLHQNRISLRVQYNPGKNGHLGNYEQTLKLELTSDTPLIKEILRRKECVDNLKTPRPDLQAVTDLQAQKALNSLKDKKLVHIFTAAIERRFFYLRHKNGKDHGDVEIAFDSGYLVLPKNDAYQNFSEIEIELKKGKTDFIEVIKNEIMRIAPSAKVQTLSKAKQGVQLYLQHRK